MKTLKQPNTLEVRVYDEVRVVDVVPKNFVQIQKPPRLFAGVVSFVENVFRPLQPKFGWASLFARPPTKNPNVGPFLAFNDEWFRNHQEGLLFLLNAPILRYWFRYVLRIHGKRSDVGGLDIHEIAPHYIAYKKSKWRFSKEFRTHPKFSKRIYHAFKPLWWMLHFWDWILADWAMPQWSFGFSTLTAYPDSGTGGTTCDGQVGVNGDVSNGSWAAKRDAAAGDTAFPSLSSGSVDIECSTSSGTPWRTLARIIFLFDTSSIPDTDTIDSSTLSLYANSKANGFASLTSAQKDVEIVSSNPALNTTITVADYSSLGTTTFSTINYDSISTSAYNDFALNASGLSNISKVGVSKFGARNGADMDNSEPGFESAKEWQVNFSMADGSNDPTLVVNHSAAVTDLDINVNDTVTVAESISLTLENNINVNDSTTVSEAITMLIDFNISVSDSTTVTESVTLMIDLNINVNDAITVTENITMMMDMSINVNDAITVTENITVDFIGHEISVFDSVTVAESVSVEIPDLGGISVVDTITVEESVTVSLGDLEISVYDQATLSESVNMTLEFNVSVFEAVTVSESIQMSMENNISVFDSVTVSENSGFLTVWAPIQGLVHKRSTQQMNPLAMDSVENVTLANKMQSRPISLDNTEIL